MKADETLAILERVARDKAELGNDLSICWCRTEDEHGRPAEECDYCGMIQVLAQRWLTGPNGKRS